MPNLSDYNPAVKYGANLDVNVDLADIRDQNDNELMEFTGVASAVNYLGIINAATTNSPRLAATGEADLGLIFQNDQAEEMLILDANATAVNEITIDNAATGENPVIAATGDDTNVSLQLTPKGTGLTLAGDTNTATIVSGSATINAQRGRLTTASLTTAAGTAATLDLKNNKIGVGSNVQAMVVGGGNTGGIPVIAGIVCRSAGSATFTLLNATGGTSLNGTVDIAFVVLS